MNYKERHKRNMTRKRQRKLAKKPAPIAINSSFLVGR